MAIGCQCGVGVIVAYVAAWLSVLVVFEKPVAVSRFVRASLYCGLT